MGGLRVSGGELRGRRLIVPKGSPTRPTTERVREAVFSILGPIEDFRVLDLFCGSGALGIEALSRGAGVVTLVDTDTRPAAANIDALEIADRLELVRSDAVAYLERAPAHGFDLILCDPPYKLADPLGAELEPPIRRALAPSGRLVTESSPRSPVEIGLPLLTERRYGDTLIRIHGGEGAS